MKVWLERGGWVSKYGRNQIRETSRYSVKRIAIIRHAAFGDMVLVRPFLVEVRKFFPYAEITLSVVSHYQYAIPHDLIDALHILDGRKRTILGWLKERKSLGRIDILFDLADTARSRYLSLVVEANLKMGFPYRGYLRWLIYDAAVFRSDYSFEAVNMLDILMLLGANPAVPLDFGWKVLFNSPKKKRVVYFAFASIENKNWGRENFFSLVDRMATAYPNHEHVLLEGLGAEEKLDIFASLEQKYQNVLLQSFLSLDILKDFLSHSSLLIANDTGVRNLAIAVGTPTVGVFYSTVPYRYWPRCRRHVAVFESNGIRPKVEDVFSAAMDLLEIA
jgi:ADP-heptose:LPS heptosyltransferase